MKMPCSQPCRRLASMAAKNGAAIRQQRLERVLNVRPAVLLHEVARHTRRRRLRHTRRQRGRRWLRISRLQAQRCRCPPVSWFEARFEGAPKRAAGARRVGRALRVGQLGVRPLGGPFVSGRVLARRRGDRRVRVYHSVFGGCAVCGGARRLSTVCVCGCDKKKRFFPFFWHR